MECTFWYRGSLGRRKSFDGFVGLAFRGTKQPRTCFHPSSLKPEIGDILPQKACCWRDNEQYCINGVSTAKDS
jgi:hypothetical protein